MLVTTAACSALSGSGGDGTVTIALGGAADNHDLDPDNVLATALADELGVEIHHEPMPEDISASLAAGDSPDLFRVTRSQLEAYVAQGLVLDLSDYEDDLGEYVEFVGQDTVDLGRIDGQLSAITPYQNDTNDTTYWIRQDWLDELGLDTPTTAEEFRDVLRGFTEDDPDGNGQNDTYGLTGASPDSTFAPLWGAFGTPGPGRIYVGEDGEVRSGYEDEGMADAVEYIADLQTSGFIDPDSYSLEGLEARDRGFQGSAGVMAVSWTAVKKVESWELSQAANPDADWQQLDLFENTDGLTSGIAVSTDAAVQYALPATLEGDDEKIEQILSLINYTATEEGSNLVNYGLEGTHYEVGDAGEIEPLPALETEGGAFFVYQVAGREEVPYLHAKFPEQRAYYERSHEQMTVPSYETFVIAPEGYDQADAERFVEDEMVQFLTGARPASEYQDFLDTMNSEFGYDEFVTAAGEQLTELGIAD